MNKHALKLFTRILASVLAFILLSYISVGTFGALADNSGQIEAAAVSEQSGAESSEADSSSLESSPESSEEENSEADSSSLESSPESSEEESSDADTSTPESSEEETPETEAVDLSGYFSQFASKVILTGNDGIEIATPAEMRITDKLKIHYTIDLNAETLAAILKDGDTQYTVHIPEELTVKDGLYEVKAHDKLLGTLRAYNDNIYFVFNADEDSIFGGEPPDALKDIQFDIPCAFDIEAIGGNAEIEVDLSEYKNGGIYDIKFAALLIAPTQLTNGADTASGHLTETSAANGEVRFNGLPFGTYYVKEISAPVVPAEIGLHSYAKSNEVLTVTIAASGTATVSKSVVKNELLGSLTITKVDKDNPSKKLQGAGFTLYDKATDQLVHAQELTDFDGVAVFTGLTLGKTYIVRETKTPTGYETRADYEVEPVYDANASAKYNIEVTLDNELEGIHGFYLWKKGAFDETVDGVKFGLYTDVACSVPLMSGNANVTATSGSGGVPGTDGASASGKVVFTKLKPGTYYVRELRASAGYTPPDRYNVSDSVIMVEIGIAIQNEWNDNATFTWDSSDPMVKLTGGNSGDVVVINQNTGKLTITKKDALDSGITVEGAVFDLYNSNGSGGISGAAIDTQTTNSFGVCEFKGLDLTKTYIVREREFPIGGAYVADTNWQQAVVFASPPQSLDACEYKLDVTNARNPVYSFGFKKKDDNGRFLKNIAFGLYSDDNCTTAVTGVGGVPVTAASGTDGTVKFTGLVFGTYYVKEIADPTDGTDRYQADDVVLKVDIENGGSYNISRESGTDSLENEPSVSVTAGTVSGLSVINKLLGSVTVIKRDIFGQPLSGVTFILTGGSVNKSSTTNADGAAKFDRLPLGVAYTVSEDAPLPGYDSGLAISPITPAYVSGDLTQHHVTVQVTNERQTPFEFGFLKHDPFGEPLEGAEFGIIQAADNATLVSVSGGQNFTPDSHIDSDADGKVIFSDLSFGRCFIRETKPPNGFAKSNLVLQVDIEWADPANVWNSFTHITVRNAVTGAVIQRKGNGDIAVVNDRKSYGISFDKVDGSTGTGLVGAVFSITPIQGKDGNTVILPAGTPITATSDSYDPSAKIPQGELKLYAKYLGVNELDNTHNTYNPSTGDNAERKPAAVVAIIALITVIAACSLDKRYHRT